MVAAMAAAPVIMEREIRGALAASASGRVWNVLVLGCGIVSGDIMRIAARGPVASEPATGPLPTGRVGWSDWRIVGRRICSGGHSMYCASPRPGCIDVCRRIPPWLWFCPRHMSDWVDRRVPGRQFPPGAQGTAKGASRGRSVVVVVGKCSGGIIPISPAPYRGGQKIS